MKKLLSLVSVMSISSVSAISVYNIKSFSNLNNSDLLVNESNSSLNSNSLNSVYLNKTDISKFKFGIVSISLDKDEYNLKESIYSVLLNQYPMYSDFIQILIDDNQTDFIITGNHFVIPEKGKTNHYQVLIVAKTSSLTYSGVTKINIELSQYSSEKTDISAFSYVTNESDLSSYFLYSNNYKDNFEQKKDIDKSKILQLIDERICNPEIGDIPEEWKNDHYLLKDNISNFLITQTAINLEKSNQCESYYRVDITVINDNNIFAKGKTLSVYFKEESEYNEIIDPINFSMNQRIGSHWNSARQWNEPTNDQEHISRINISDYVRKDEINKYGSLLEAFKHKYQYLKFNISGYYLNYDDERQDIINVLFTTGSLSVNNSISADSLNYDHTKQTGTVSSGRLTITVKINSDNTLIYSWFCHIRVRGEGAPYSHTEINATVNNLEFIKDSKR